MGPFKHDREFYRLEYPPAGAPTFVELGVARRVVDIGEGGFRFAHDHIEQVLAGQRVSGVIEFPEGESLNVEGTVVRVQNGEVAVHCAPRVIPLSIVLSEQRRLRRRFPFRG
jgi:hypothetical protein